MANESSTREPQPLLAGRVTRIVFGIATLLSIPLAGLETLGWLGTGLATLLGASFIVGGLLRNPGCELTALPNLFLQPGRRVYTR